MKLDLTLNSGPVTVTGDSLDIDLDPTALIEEMTDAIAEEIKTAIRAQPDSKWNRTGHLLRGIQADGGTVSAPTDRLGQDELAQRFAAEVVPADPTANRRVDNAIDKVVDDMIGKA